MGWHLIKDLVVKGQLVNIGHHRYVLLELLHAVLELLGLVLEWNSPDVRLLLGHLKHVELLGKSFAWLELSQVRLQLDGTLYLQDILILLYCVVGWAYVHEIVLLTVLHTTGLVGELGVQGLGLLLSHVHLEVLLDFLVVLLKDLAQAHVVKVLIQMELRRSGVTNLLAIIIAQVE